MEHLLLRYWWLGATLWIVTYTADYYLTLWGATLRTRCDPESDSHGSYELTPEYRSDIDARRALSRRFVLSLAFGILLLLAYAQLAVLLRWPPLYLLTVGLMVLIEVPVIIRHVRNIAIFRFALAHGGWKNPRASMPALLWASASELLGFAAFFFICAVVSASWLALGGAMRCLILGLQHGAMSRAQRAAEAAAPAAAQHQQA
jgi:hypothetical protein